MPDTVEAGINALLLGNAAAMLPIQEQLESLQNVETFNDRQRAQYAVKLGRLHGRLGALLIERSKLYDRLATLTNAR